MAELLEKFLQTFTYFALILVLLAAGMGVPIPEDVPLVTAGYLSNPDHSPIAMGIDTNGDGKKDQPTPESRRRVPNVYLMIIAGMVGVLGGDSIVFFIGRRGIDGNNFVARHIRKVMTPKRRGWTERHFEKHGTLTVFCGRFMPGFRSVIFAMAGMARMSYLRFMIVDGFAALISVPVFILLGWYFAGNIHALLHHIKQALIPIIIGLIVVFVMVMWVKQRRAKRQALLAASAPVTVPSPDLPRPVNEPASPVGGASSKV